MIQKAPFIIAVTFLIGITFILIYTGGLTPSPHNDFDSDFIRSLNIFTTFSVPLFLLLLLPYVIYIRYYIKTYYYDGSDTFVTIKKGVFAPTEIHVQYLKIQDVYVDQDVLDRIMGLYDVHLSSATATSGMEAHIDGVDKHAAEGLKSFLLGKIQLSDMSNKIPVPNTQSQVATKNDVRFNSFEEISNITYPLHPLWLITEIISAAITAVWFLIGLAFVVIFVSFGFGILKEGIPIDILNKSFLWRFIPLIYIAIFIYEIVYVLIWKSNYKFKFFPDYIYIHEAVLSRQEKQIPYRAVQDVTVTQDLIYRLFGLANVVIRNAADIQSVPNRRISNDIIIRGQIPENAEKIAEILKKIILTKNASRTGL